MIRIFSTFVAVAFAASILLIAPAATAAGCKGATKTACSANNACTWVDGYEKKDGVTVRGHCRALPTAASKAKKKASDAKKKASTKAKSVKEKANDKKEKAAAKKKKATEKAKDAKKKGAKKADDAKKKAKKKASKKASKKSESAKKKAAGEPSADWKRVLVVIMIATTIGGFVFNSMTVSLPKVLNDRMTDLAFSASEVGAIASAVYAVAAFNRFKQYSQKVTRQPGIGKIVIQCKSEAHDGYSMLTGK